MDKQTVLTEFYRSQISVLVEQTADPALLDFIYKLLLKEQNKCTNTN